MPSGPLAFKQTDVARALRAAAKAVGEWHVRIDRATGDLLILPGAGPAANVVRPTDPAADLDADLDRELGEWQERQWG
ncbi:hypothetical protein [Brevundimonas aurantiaca]|uniref:hypothetical protein n=1 Tax=Brevundimonas aurantiaca TaxID=74316 RepID=UPI00191B3C96|nr:hypothetical protein [Brevundimonas aurantiaca]